MIYCDMCVIIVHDICKILKLYGLVNIFNQTDFICLIWYTKFTGSTENKLLHD